jgi:lipopolysaccharide/colanic/teichoic acid biosynthesis glycosyltransferase
MNLSYRKTGKKIFDLLFSFLLLVVAWPLFIIISLIIKLTSKGPVFFKQPRIGKKGKVFTIYKFRTMVNNAEKLQDQYQQLNEADGPVFKIKKDPRFTNKFTRLLAKTGLDELPNIFNVLLNQMSWVGPRPLPIKEAKQINKETRIIRQSVLPGITSLWIVKGAHNLDFKEWMKLDIDYTKKINLLTDLKILVKTSLLSLKIIFVSFKKLFQNLAKKISLNQAN